MTLIMGTEPREEYLVLELAAASFSCRCSMRSTTKTSEVSKTSEVYGGNVTYRLL